MRPNALEQARRGNIEQIISEFQLHRLLAILARLREMSGNALYLGCKRKTPNEIRHRNVATDTKAHQSVNKPEPMFHARVGLGRFGQLLYIILRIAFCWYALCG